LQEENDKLITDNAQINAEMALLQAELSVLKDKVVILTAENDLLKMKLEHKEEIIALHNYYINKK
jgi:cell division protein FtsB